VTFPTTPPMGPGRRLPDPPVGRLDAARVTLSDEAVGPGGPDSPIAIPRRATDTAPAPASAPAAQAARAASPRKG
jgi:hypothetical protein